MSCSSDCPLNKEDNMCLPYPDDNVCDPDCPKFGKFADANCKQGLILTNAALIAILLVVLGLLFRNLSKE